MLRIIFFSYDTATLDVYTLSLTTLFRSDKKNRILVVELDNKLIGLIVNAASEVLKIPPSEIEAPGNVRSEEHTSELQSRFDLVCRLLLEKKKVQTRRKSF